LKRRNGIILHAVQNRGVDLTNSTGEHGVEETSSTQVWEDWASFHLGEFAGTEDVGTSM